jgi:prepilin signal peptidase PulO-like enzyme (type II secretory pathway)
MGIHNTEMLSRVIFYAAVLLSGLCAGSFLNVLIYRLPLMIKNPQCKKFNLFFPRSHCPHCRHILYWYENIPLLSWLMLKGRCSSCHQRISGGYFLTELAALGLTIICLAIIPPGIPLLAAMIFSLALLALAQIDYCHQLLPDLLTIPLLWTGLFFHMTNPALPLADAVLGAIAGYISLWSIYWGYRMLTGKEALGHGDFKLLAALGAWTGWQSLPAIVLLACLLAMAVTLLISLFREQNMQEAIAFGPWLALSGWLIFLIPDFNPAIYVG